MKQVTILEVEYLAYSLAKKLMTWDEPIPEFGSRFPNILESCLATPFQTYGGTSLYSGLIPKAAILFYLMVKNHPFKNGNKRIAVTTLLLFLSGNQKWVKVDPAQLYRFAKWVAESDPKVKDATVSAIEKFLTVYLVAFPV
jgi:death-on-curing family protein